VGVTEKNTEENIRKCCWKI